MWFCGIGNRDSIRLWQIVNRSSAFFFLPQNHHFLRSSLNLHKLGHIYLLFSEYCISQQHLATTIRYLVILINGGSQSNRAKPRPSVLARNEVTKNLVMRKMRFFNHERKLHCVQNDRLLRYAVDHYKIPEFRMIDDGSSVSHCKFSTAKCKFQISLCYLKLAFCLAVTIDLAMILP